jgi:hypothetical protein
LECQKSSAWEAGGSDSCSSAKTLRVASCRRPIAAQFTGQEDEHKIDLVVVWLLRMNLLFLILSEARQGPSSIVGIPLHKWWGLAGSKQCLLHVRIQLPNQALRW